MEQQCTRGWVAKTKARPSGDFPGGPVVKTSWVLGSIPGQDSRSHLLQLSSLATAKYLVCHREDPAQPNT